MKRNIGRNSALYPTPAVIIGTMVDRKVDWMLAAHVGSIGRDHIMIGLRKSDSMAAGFKDGGRFSANIVNEALLPKADFVGSENGAASDRSNIFNWLVGEAGTPIIDMSPLVMECSVEDTYETDAFDNFICKISNTYADENILDKDGRINYELLRPVLLEMPTHTYLKSGNSIGKCYEMHAIL